MSRDLSGAVLHPTGGPARALRHDRIVLLEFRRLRTDASDVIGRQPDML